MADKPQMELIKQTIQRVKEIFDKRPFVDLEAEKRVMILQELLGLQVAHAKIGFVSMADLDLQDLIDEIENKLMDKKNEAGENPFQTELSLIKEHQNEPIMKGYLEDIDVRREDEHDHELRQILGKGAISEFLQNKKGLKN